MNTRAEAVEWFKARGFHARERDWALGQTIFVGVDPQDAHGITILRRAIYLVPVGDGWQAEEFGYPRPGDDEVMTLDAQCERVAVLLRSD